MGIGLDEGGAGRFERPSDPLDPLRQLGARGPDPDPDLTVGLVQTVQVGPDEWNAQCHRFDSSRFLRRRRKLRKSRR